MKKRFLILFIIIIFPFIAVNAQRGLFDPLTCIKDGSCSLEEMEQGFTLLTSRLVGLIGAAALLFLIYGGSRWLTSRGKEADISAGKNIIIGSITAIIIALLAGVLVRFYTEELFKVKEYTEALPQNQQEIVGCCSYTDDIEELSIQETMSQAACTNIPGDFTAGAC